MTTEREPIIWRNELVGYIENPTKYPVIWQGKWIPVDSPTTKEFITALQQGQHLWIECGNDDPMDMGVVERPPAENIRVLFSAGIDEQQTIRFIPPDVGVGS